MFNHSAELYDLIYAGFKDYAGEAAQIASLLRRLHAELAGATLYCRRPLRASSNPPGKYATLWKASRVSASAT